MDVLLPILLVLGMGLLSLRLIAWIVSGAQAESATNAVPTRLGKKPNSGRRRGTHPDPNEEARRAGSWG